MQDHLGSASATGVKQEPFLKADYQDTVARANFYRFLASLYLQPPTQEILQHFADETFIDELQSLFGDEVKTEFKALTRLDQKDCLAELHQGYMDLFVVPAGRYVAPFEDVYRGMRLDGKQERGPLLGDRAVAVKTIYRTVGANLDKTCKELPTHIGVELLFMSFLCEQEATGNEHEVRDKSNEIPDEESTASIFRQWQLKFLHEHLTDWFPQLNQAIQEKSDSSFYRGIAKLTAAFLIRDKDELMKQLRCDLQQSRLMTEQIQEQTNSKSELQ